jgi:hypothetical protein
MFDPTKGGSAIELPDLEIDPIAAHEWNEIGWGIFWTVNEFSGPRKAENLVRINAWAVDMDEGTKAEQLERIRRGLVPSLVVETSRGFHVYWNAKDGKPETYSSIVSDRLLPFYGADPKAKDLARILRVPGFKHMKDPEKPFLIRAVFTKNVAYSEAEMLHFYPVPKSAQAEVEQKRELRMLLGSRSDDLWERVWSMDCEEALHRLSGSRWVNGEVFSFRRVSNGNHNIYVNGKSTSCWIDQNQRIGSLDKGGPTVFNWLRWYGYSNAEVYQIMREVFPEVFEGLKRGAR